jgi:biotin transport system substrate-specific component
MHTSNQLRMTVLSSLFAALIAVGAYISIPIGPVPIVMQNFFVLLTGLLLGPRWGTAAVGVYLLAGALGLPVFAGGTGGIGKFFGPTGGYLLAYLPAVFITGLISRNKIKTVWWDAVAMILASIVIYGIGVSWLKVSTGMTWSKTLAVGMLPFLLGDALKIAAAVALAKAMRPMTRMYSDPNPIRQEDNLPDVGHEHH